MMQGFETITNQVISDHIFDPSIQPNQNRNSKKISFKCILIILLMKILLFLLVMSALGQNTSEFPFIIALRRNLQTNSQISSCIIGYSANDQTSASQNATTIAILESLYQDYIGNSKPNTFKYCKYKNTQAFSVTKSQSLQSCIENCCIQSDQSCYLWHLKAQEQYKKRATSFDQQIGNNAIVSATDNSSNKNTTQAKNDDQSHDSVNIVIIILACTFGIPIFLIFLLSIITIIKNCRKNQMLRPLFVNATVPTPAPSVQHEEQINLNDYNIDEVGPYHINHSDICAICMEQNLNLRTLCGHSYHPKCIREWYVKCKANLHCPLCNSTKYNPMKVYCQKCHSAVKLIKFSMFSSDQEIKAIEQTLCTFCDNKNLNIQGPASDMFSIEQEDHQVPQSVHPSPRNDISSASRGQTQRNSHIDKKSQRRSERKSTRLSERSSRRQE